MRIYLNFLSKFVLLVTPLYCRGRFLVSNEEMNGKGREGSSVK